MRGQYTLFNTFVEAPSDPTPGGKGRSLELIAERNQCMMYRYYYLIKIKKMQYLDALDELGRQFYISTVTVIYQMQKSEGKLRAVMAENASVATLAAKYPWLKW